MQVGYSTIQILIYFKNLRIGPYMSLGGRGEGGLGLQGHFLEHKVEQNIFRT